MSDRSPGPDEQYCPNCRAIISRRAEMCPECNTFDLAETGAPRGGAAQAPAGDGPGAGTRYCPNCGATISAKAEMCPECNTLGLQDGAGTTAGGGERSGSDQGSSPDVVEDAVDRAGSARERIERGHLYAGAGAALLVLSVLTFVLSFLFTFSFFVGIVVLPLSGLFGIVGTGLGYYSLFFHRSKLGGGVAVVGTLEASVVAGTVVLGIMIILGAVALSSPFRLARALYLLYRFIEEVLFEVLVPLAA